MRKKCHYFALNPNHFRCKCVIKGGFTVFSFLTSRPISFTNLELKFSSFVKSVFFSSNWLHSLLFTDYRYWTIKHYFKAGNWKLLGFETQLSQFRLLLLHAIDWDLKIRLNITNLHINKPMTLVNGIFFAKNGGILIYLSKIVDQKIMNNIFCPKLNHFYKENILMFTKRH